MSFAKLDHQIRIAINIILTRQFDPKDKNNEVKEPTIVFDKNYFIEEKHTLEEKLQQAFSKEKVFL